MEFLYCWAGAIGCFYLVKWFKNNFEIKRVKNPKYTKRTVTINVQSSRKKTRNSKGKINAKQGIKTNNARTKNGNVKNKRIVKNKK